MNMIVTLKSIKKGFFKVKIKPAIGESIYRELTSAALCEYLQAADTYCEIEGYDLHFFIPEAIKKMAAHWMESEAASNNNE